jgi:hypothetical protein
MPATRSGPCTLFLLFAALAFGDAPLSAPPQSAIAGDTAAARGMPCLREGAVGATAGAIISADAVSPTDPGGGVDEARSREAPAHAPQSVHALRMIGVCSEPRPAMPVGADRRIRTDRARWLNA